MATKDDLLTRVLSLPPEERAEVAHKLLLSLDDEPAQEASGSEWAQELERRATDIREGRVETVPWEDVERQVVARLK
ncbi:addiction module protein [Myxococcus sp. CA051A]|uniref:addiction module protein n=1 Tax=unclassified Myxococcus TaxID=2648731 RepID=UPI00157B1C1F|nr:MULTISPECIES: addiction module protein [unclassified Myxococcus]NTX15836.1 addiction module protein [Myxococcus sp. CA056]NTX33974.1 addiction module protein [Myxococcus sp. CA033]NTX53423.1 addiction module protein [Myxococcus sp. CA039A]NTX65295.1 addiction module protein [Myxococcus sp. CA051A]